MLCSLAGFVMPHTPPTRPPPPTPRTLSIIPAPFPHDGSLAFTLTHTLTPDPSLVWAIRYGILRTTWAPHIEKVHLVNGFSPESCAPVITSGLDQFIYANDHAFRPGEQLHIAARCIRSDGQAGPYILAVGNYVT